MSTDSSQQFLDDLDRKLWTAADRLRANLDAAVTNTPSSASSSSNTSPTRKATSNAKPHRGAFPRHDMPMFFNMSERWDANLGPYVN